VPPPAWQMTTSLKQLRLWSRRSWQHRLAWLLPRQCCGFSCLHPMLSVSVWCLADGRKCLGQLGGFPSCNVVYVKCLQYVLCVKCLQCVLCVWCGYSEISSSKLVVYHCPRVLVLSVIGVQGGRQCSMSQDCSRLSMFNVNPIFLQRPRCVC
jgi:hypothetical protein